MLRSGSLALRFLIELATFAALGRWGASVPGGALERVCLAVLLPAAAIALWSMFLAPRARRRLADPAALVLEVAIFAAAALALWSSGAATGALAFAAVAVGNAAVLRTLSSGGERANGRPHAA